MYTSLVKNLDKIAGLLQEKGLRKFAEEIDIVSNTLEDLSSDQDKTAANISRGVASPFEEGLEHAEIRLDYLQEFLTKLSNSQLGQTGITTIRKLNQFVAANRADVIRNSSTKKIVDSPFAEAYRTWIKDLKAKYGDKIPDNFFYKGSNFRNYTFDNLEGLLWILDEPFSSGASQKVKDWDPAKLEKAKQQPGAERDWGELNKLFKSAAGVILPPKFIEIGRLIESLARFQPPRS